MEQNQQKTTLKVTCTSNIKLADAEPFATLLACGGRNVQLNKTRVYSEQYTARA